mgnify:CR=1 FL=1
MNDENKKETYHWKNQGKITVKKIFILFLMFIFVCFACKFGYDKYQILDFQKRYKEAPPGSIIKTGNMKKARSEHCNIKLIDGSVLVVGGNKGAEIFNPKTGQYKLIDKNIKDISFNFHNYFLLNNGDVIFSNKYKFNKTSKKIIKINQNEEFYNSLYLSGHSTAISNTYIHPNKKNILLMPFFSQEYGFKLECYDIKTNSIIQCDKWVLDNYQQYLFPFNKIFQLDNDKCLILLTFDPDKYKESFSVEKIRPDAQSLDFVILDFNKGKTSLKFPNVQSYNIKSAIFENNNVWLIDQNSNLFNFSTKDLKGNIKIEVPFGYAFNQSKLIRVNDDLILIISPVFSKPYKLLVSHYSIKNNRILKTNEINYKNISSRKINIVRSYDVLLLDDNTLLINGGQDGISTSNSKVNESFIYKFN